MVGDRDHTHRDRERIVALGSFGTRFEADVVIAMLETHGIKAVVGGVESAYGSPNLGLTGPVRVEVLESDVQRATELLDADADSAPA